MIKKVIYPNLDVHKERCGYMQKRLRELGVPSEKIYRCRAMDAADYETHLEIAEAASDDGFPEVLKFAGEGRDFFRQKGDIGYQWTMRRVLREVKSIGTCMVILDDAELVKEFREYEELVEKAGEFDIIQFENCSVTLSDHHHTEIIGKLPNPTVCPFDARFVYGMIYYGEFVNVYSVEGARKTLELLGHREMAIEQLPTNIGHGVFRCIGPNGQTQDWGRGADIKEEWLSYRHIMNEQEST